MAAYVGLGLGYALKIPRWNAPDEPAHYNYIKHIAEQGKLPVLQAGDYDQAYIRELTAARFPEGMPVDTLRYESHQPPLYYLMTVPLYRAGLGLSVEGRVLLLRLFSLLLGMGVVALAYFVAAEVFPNDRLLALAVPAFVALVPMHIAATAAINDDALAELVLALILLVLVRSLRWGFSPLRSLGLGGLLGLALLTKTTVYVTLVLAPAAFLARELAMGPQMRDKRGWLRRPAYDGPVKGKARPDWRPGAWTLFLALFMPARAPWPRRLAGFLVFTYGTALLLAGWWFGRNMLVYGAADPLGLGRHALVVVGQPRMAHDLEAVRRFIAVGFRSFWAQFGWMGILIDERLYLLLALLSALAAFGLGLVALDLARGRPRFTPHQTASLGLMLFCWALVLGGMVFYNLTYDQPQGRYLFPALIPISFLFALGLRELMAPRYAGLLFLGLYAGLFVVNVASLTLFIAPYFAPGGA